ncbi:MAG: MoaD/ThiS family protein [Clostridia bacterium]|nr:MoaD/ThiS family protein [Clostridia bacterium]
MSVQIIVHPFFLHLVEGQEIVEVEGRRVGECLASLVRRYPALKQALFDRHGRLRGWIEIYCNDRTTYPDELDHLVADGDQLRITVLAVGGG